jgi:DNA repair/transcription protein MET18/MMS19
MYSDAMIDLLSSISSFAPRHVAETTLPVLFSALPDNAPARESGAERAKYWHILSLLSKLCIQQTLFETLVIRLSTKLDLICSTHSEIASEADMEPCAAYAHSILRTLAKVLSVKVEASHPDVSKYLERLVLPLYRLFVSSALSSEDGKNAVATDRRLIAVAGEIILSVMQILPVQ